MSVLPPPAAALMTLVEGRAARVGVIGLGYVGLPLALACARAGFRTTGFDINPARIAAIAQGEQVIAYLPADEMQAQLASGMFSATADFARLAAMDAIFICVPTPLTRHREPDLSYIRATARSIAATLRAGQLILLESTTWPGTTREVVKPILEEGGKGGGLRSGEDFFLAFTPEREDPGNTAHSTATIPKVVGGEGEAALALADALLSRVVARTVRVSSTATAEAVKLTENIFRAVNIALVNELKGVYAAMGIDIWEVIEAAKTKPFGFMPFYPGPGLGGHCIPIDPFYLSWKAREFAIETRFIDLAGEINTRMPHDVVAALRAALDGQRGRGLSGARILVLGIAYKKNVDDIRESPALKLIELIEAAGARTVFHDPFVTAIPHTREHAALAGRRSVALAQAADCDAVLLVTDHDGIDYATIARTAPLIVDTRNAFARHGTVAPHIVKA